MAITTKKRNVKITRQKKAIRKSMWPKLKESELWLYRNVDGWLTIPRAMPLILRIADMLAPRGKPVSQTYLDLWCRTFDDGFVIVSKPREMAFYSGFSRERAEHTWSTRMRILQELGFIDIQGGPSGPINYVLIFNPYHVIKRHHAEGAVDEMAFNGLLARMVEIGAFDMEDDSDEEPKVVKKKKKRKKVGKKVAKKTKVEKE